VAIVKLLDENLLIVAIVKVLDENLRKGGQFHQVIMRNALDGVAGFAPGSKAACDDVNFES
jgi:hypothetical protein